MEATEAVASGVVEVSVEETVEAMEEVAEDLEGATKWAEGWLMLMQFFYVTTRWRSLP